MQSFKRTIATRALAWVLAFVMVFTMIPYGAFAAGEAGEGKVEMAPAKGPVAVRDAAPPEDTDTASDAKNAVHGYVGVQVGDDVNKNLAKADKSQFIPKEGVKVYFQWFEKKGNRISPVYAATSDASGQFHMKIKPYIGEDGKLVKFDADTTSSAGTESYKFWVDESTIPAGYQLQYSTGESVEFNDTGVAGANNYVIPNKLTDFKVLLMEIPKEDLMHKTATPTPPQIFADPVGNVGQGAVRGKVSWDYESAGGIQWGIVATHTSPAPGVKVRASYLSDYALKQIFSADTANMLSVGGPGQIRGKGWTFALEKQLQDWIKEQVEKDPENWIAETVSDVTNAKGEYKIQFNGTWGPERNGVNVANYTAPKLWTQEQKDRLGTVAKNATDGSFLTGALDKNQKHINSDWLFISTEGTDKLRVMTPWNNNWYTGSNNAWGIHDGWAQAAFGVSTVQAANSTRADFAFAPAEIKFNITNYDTGFNTATPGDVAKTETKGLPYSNTSDSFRIVWYDAKGNVVKTENASKPSSIGDFPEATYDTKDVTETTTFTAKLYRVDAKGNNGQLLAQDSFTVKISKLVVSAHDEVNIPNPGANDESMKGATYSAEGLPEGLTIDPNNGTISGKATTPGKYTVTVKTSVPDKDSGEDAVGTSQYVALVTDSPLKDGNVNSDYSETVKPTEVKGYVFKNVTAKFIDGKAIDGLTITGDQISGTPTVEVDAKEDEPNVEVTYDIYKLNDKGQEVLIKKGHVDKVPLSIKDGESAKYEPEYTPVNGTVGTPATVAAPTFKDADGQSATPQNVTYELGKDAPTGAKVNDDGSVTYTPVEADADKAVEIPVVVKYADGTTDNAKAVINVAKKATTADKVKELGGLNPQTIKVWKGDNFAWADGVVPANDTNSDAVNALLANAKVTDKQNPARDSSEAGKHEGTLLVTFADGSSMEVPKQMLIVSEHVVVIDPNNTDPDAPKEQDLPGDKIKVAFNKREGIANIDTKGKTTFAKPNAVLADTDFPADIEYVDGYKKEVTWTPTDHKVDTSSKYYDRKRNTFKFFASATLPDVIDRTGNEDKPTPDGYVRVTFTNGEGVNDIENNKVYDVKAGTKLSADKYPTVTAKDGYENPVWSVAAGTAITKDTQLPITATATEKAPAVKDADKYTPSYADKDGKAGVEVTTDAPTFTDADGKDAKAPDGTKYSLGDKAPKGASIDENTGKVTYTPSEKDAGKPVEIPVVVTYPDKSTDNATATINVEALPDIIDRTGDEDKPTPDGYVRVTFTNGEGVNDIENNKVYDVKAGTKLSADKYPTVTAKDGYENPVWSVAAGTAITKDTQLPITATATATTPAGQTAKPVITAPKAGDKTISGTSVPNAKVVVELPDGTKVETTADGEGNWTANVPAGKEPKENDIVKAVATVDGKTPSEEATAKTTAATPAEQTGKPNITAPKAGDKTITGTSEPNAKVVVELPDGTKVETTADNDGNWTANVPTGKELKENDVVKATATVGGKTPSEEATATVTGENPGQSEKPSINEPTEGDNTITGTGTPGAEVVVTDKDGKEIGKTTVGTDGKWSVPVPADRPLKKGDKIIATQTEQGKDPASAEATVKGKDNGNGGYWIIPWNPTTPSEEAPKHETAIHKLYIYGYEDTSFRPEGNMTRAEAAAMIARLQGLDLSNKARPGFIDVRSGWYNAVVNAVVNAGYMKGYPDGTFRPNGKITRAEFAQMIKAIDKANTGMAPFADAKGHWAEAAINQAYANARITGYPDGTFRPNNHITRAEAVTVFNKLYDRCVGEPGLADVKGRLVEFNDINRSHWAYFQVVESSNTHEFYRTEKGKIDETWVRVLQTWKEALANR